MMEIREQIIQEISKRKPFVYFLLATLLFFTAKGIEYAWLNSFVPLLVISVLMGLIIFGLFYSVKTFRFFIGLWSLLIISWSVIRLLLTVVDTFIKPIPEAHVHDQLGVYGTLISLAFLIAGIYLWKNRKRND